MSGLRALAPDRWDAFAAPIREKERVNMLQAYWRLLSGHDATIRSMAARAWCAFEQHFTRLLPAEKIPEKSDEQLVALARIEAHYFRHG